MSDLSIYQPQSGTFIFDHEGRGIEKGRKFAILGIPKGREFTTLVIEKGPSLKRAAKTTLQAKRSCTYSGK